MIIILVIGGIVYYNMSKDDDDKGTPATTSATSAGDILRGFGATESFTNIKNFILSSISAFNDNIFILSYAKYKTDKQFNI